jgi:hypothetical protein
MKNVIEAKQPHTYFPEKKFVNMAKKGWSYVEVGAIGTGLVMLGWMLYMLAAK